MRICYISNIPHVCRQSPVSSFSDPSRPGFHWCSFWRRMFGIWGC